LLVIECNVGRDYRIPIALSNDENEFIVSPAYDVFEIIDTNYCFQNI
jgi:type I restriction enzyme S subunit